MVLVRKVVSYFIKIVDMCRVGPMMCVVIILQLRCAELVGNTNCDALYEPAQQGMLLLLWRGRWRRLACGQGPVSSDFQAPSGKYEQGAVPSESQCNTSHG